MRCSCKEALKHPWLSEDGDAKNYKDIASSVQTQMKKSFAKQKWKRAFHATSAIRQMQKLRIASDVSGKMKECKIEDKN